MAFGPFSHFPKERGSEDNSQTNGSVMSGGDDCACCCSLAASVLSCMCILSDYQNSRVPKIPVPEQWSSVPFLPYPVATNWHSSCTGLHVVLEFSCSIGAYTL